MSKLWGTPTASIVSVCLAVLPQPSRLGVVLGEQYLIGAVERALDGSAGSDVSTSRYAPAPRRAEGMGEVGVLDDEPEPGSWKLGSEHAWQRARER